MCPERAEVEVVSDQLKDLIIGKTLIDIKYDKYSRYSKGGIPDFSCLKFPYQCIEIKTRGKKIIFTLESDKDQVFLLSFLGMTGRWLVKPIDHSNLWLEFGSIKQSDDGKSEVKECDFKIYFDDSRHFGTFTVYPDRKSLDAFLKRTTGPDLLTDDVTLEEWTKKIKNPRTKNKAICLFLLDQKQFSGIGAYLRAEILYACKISPFRKLCELSDEDIKTLLITSKEKIKASYEANGLTIKDYLAPDGSRGEFKQVIYDKKEDPLGNPVVKEKDSKAQSARTIHWVPLIQK